MTIEKYNYYAIRGLIIVFAIAGLIHTITDLNGVCFTPASFWRGAFHPAPQYIDNPN